MPSNNLPPNPILAANIHVIRTALGLTKTDFGKLIDVNRTTVANYEESRTTPNVIAALYLSKKVGITVEHLCEKEINQEELLKNLARARIMK